MRKWLAMILSVSLVLSSFFTLGSAVSAASKFNITEDAAIAARIKDFADIKALFTDNTDLSAVKKFYADKFQTEVKRIDATIKPDDPKIDENISIVLDNAIAGTLNVGQAKQAIDKGLQWYFYFAIRDLINNQVRPALKSGDNAAAQTAFYKVVQIYEGVLQATVVKRDNSYSLHMADILNGTIEQLLSDLASGKADDFNVHRQVLDKTLIKTFALAASYVCEKHPDKTGCRSTGCDYRRLLLLHGSIYLPERRQRGGRRLYPQRFRIRRCQPSQLGKNSGCDAACDDRKSVRVC